MRRSSRVTTRPATAPEPKPAPRRSARLAVPDSPESSMSDAAASSEVAGTPPVSPYQELAVVFRQVMTPEDGKVGFRQPVYLSPYVRIKGFRWYYGTGLFDEKVRLTVALDIQPTPFGGLHGIAHTSNPSEEQPDALCELLHRASELQHCHDCCGIYAQQQLVKKRCPGCHLACQFLPEVHDCSYCQYPAQRSYVTKCGHHFHFACLSDAVENVRLSRETLPDWIDPTSKFPLLCPNCRASLEPEFRTYFLTEGI
jgi:hypothetical protein